jgi:hypothetical protein
MKTFREFLEAKKTKKEIIVPGKTSYELPVPVQTKRYEPGAKDIIEPGINLLQEK